MAVVHVTLAGSSAPGSAWRGVRHGSVPTPIALPLLAVALSVFYGLLDFVRRRLLVVWFHATVCPRLCPLSWPSMISKEPRDLDAICAFLSRTAPCEPKGGVTCHTAWLANSHLYAYPQR